MKKILYLGDTNLQDAAAYLAGLMTHWNWSFDYRPSDAPLDPSDLETEYGLFILSDYPAVQMNDETQLRLLAQVAGGAGLVMLGGWESYHGLGGDWDGTPIAKALPVEIATSDDRRNFDRPVFVQPVKEHAITQNLPWCMRPPVIGGMNQVQAKPDAELLLDACVFNAAWENENQMTFDLAERLPLLVLGQHEGGHTAAFMTDIAPHWVGPLVDWGETRIEAHAPNSHEIEVGNLYALFFQQLLEWVRGGN